MKTIGHHTTSGEGDLFEVRDKAPFISSGGPMDWMGKGYYFWDNDDEAAHYWGKSHYKNNYYIFKSELELNSIDFFDLVGNREHMIFMTKAFQRFSKFKKPEERWSLRKMFDLLRDLNTKPNTLGIFPYKVARCIDCINNGGNKVLIVEGRNAHVNLKPKLVICVFHKDGVILQPQMRIVHPNIGPN